MRTESPLQAYLIKQARLHGGRGYKLATPGRRGMPDVLLIAGPTRFRLVECKSPSGHGRLDALQEREIERLYQVGVTADVCESKKHADEIIAALFTAR